MKISLLLAINVGVLFLIFAVSSFVIIDVNSQELRKTAILHNTSLADSMILEIDQYIKNRIDDFMIITTLQEVQSSITESNDLFGNLINVEDFIKEKEKNTDLQSNAAFLDRISKDEISIDLKETILFYEESFDHNIIDELVITNEYGASIALGAGTSDYRQDDEQWWQITKNERQYIGELEYNEIYEGYVIPFGIQVTDDNGNFIGVMRVVLSLDDILSDLVDDDSLLEQTSSREILLVDEFGRVLHPKEQLDSKIQKTSEYFSQISERRGIFEMKNKMDETILVSYSSSTGFENFGGFGWIVLIEQKEELLLDDFSEIRNTVIMVLVIGLVASLIMSAFTSKLITNPLEHLADAAKNIAKGNFVIRIREHQINEIKTIENTVKKMAVDLKNLFETEKELAETRARIKNERLTAMGELSASVAHDLKNPLAAIKSATNIIKQNSDILDPKLKELVFPKMDRAISRMTHQIDEVLNYVRITPINMTDVSIKKIIDSSLESLDVPKNIHIVKPDNDFLVRCDVEKIEIVFINLMLNAMQSISEEQGKIQIRLIDDKRQKTIELEDNGPGMPDEIIKDIFKPLFTTKQKGTGLGLAISKNVIEQHGWSITVKNNPTTFCINIPKHEENS